MVEAGFSSRNNAAIQAAFARAAIRAFSKQMASSAGSENAENKRKLERDPIQDERIML